MKQLARITLLYSLFAALATIVNLAVQMLVVFFYHGIYIIELSMLAGTSLGMPIKYVLDKHCIFFFKARNPFQERKMFFLYICTGIFTTLIFWGIEYAFQWIFESNLMRYISGTIGLILGYIIKYLLDRRFVFVNVKCS